MNKNNQAPSNGHGRLSDRDAKMLAQRSGRLVADDNIMAAEPLKKAMTESVKKVLAESVKKTLAEPVTARVKPVFMIFRPTRFVSGNVVQRPGGFTLVETLISLALLAVLFVLLGGLLTGMAKISRTAADVSIFDREIEFCGEIIRKELGEILLDNSRADYTFLGGNEFFAYTTTRDELLVRDSIPGGAKRVEWRYDPSERKLVRTVTRLVSAGSELPPVSRSYFLEGLAGIELFYFDGVSWFQVSGISSVLPPAKCIALRFVTRDDDDRQKSYETAFWLPYANPALQKF